MKKCIFALFFVVLSLNFSACKTTEEILPKEIRLEVEVGSELGASAGYVQNKVIKELGAIVFAFGGDVSLTEVSELVQVILEENGLNKGTPVRIDVNAEEVFVGIGEEVNSLNKMSIYVVV